MNKGYS